MVLACCIATQKQLEEEGSNSIHVFVQLPKLRLNLNGSFVRDGDMLPYLPRVLQLPKLRMNLNGSFVRDGDMLPYLPRVLQLPKLRMNLNGSFVRDGAINVMTRGAIHRPPTPQNFF